MEKLNYYDVVEKILQPYVNITMGKGAEVEFIADRTNGHYLIMFIGWRDEAQVYGSLIHIDIKDNQIWIQQDGTQQRIAPFMRKFSGFGVGVENNSDVKPLEGQPTY